MKAALDLIPRLEARDIDAALAESGLELDSEKRESLRAVLNNALSGYVAAHVWLARRLPERPFEREKRLKKLRGAADTFLRVLGEQEARDQLALWLEHDREIREARARYANATRVLPTDWKMLRTTAEPSPSRPGERHEAELIAELTERAVWIRDAARLAEGREREIVEARTSRKQGDEARRPLFHILIQAWPHLFGKELKVTVDTDSHKVKGEAVLFLEQVFARYAERVPIKLSAASGNVEERLDQLKGHVLHNALRDARDNPAPQLFDHFPSGN